MAPRLRLFKANPKLSVPNHFRCPVSLDLMKDPVTLSTGITYDRQSIERWLESSTTDNLTCPVTNQVLTNPELIPNHTIRKMIQDWCVTNKSFGIERIPTPRTPVTLTQMSDMLSDMELAVRLRDRAQVLDLVTKMKKLAKESERNRRCIATSGAAKVLAFGFKQFARDIEVCMEVLSVITCMCPIDEESCKRIGGSGSTEAVESIVWILTSGDLAARLNAVLVVRELAIDQERARILAKTKGLCEAIVKLIKEPISPRTTKASLVAAYYLVLSGQDAVSRFVDLGLVSLLLEILVDSEKSICEKALGVLDGILGNDNGREAAYAHALTMPVLVKKMFRVSDIATEFAVSSLWKMCKNCNNDEQGKRLAESALSVGAFQKLLLLLQVGCSEGTKEKASEMLKMLNGWRGNAECIESADFKGLKRNF